MVSSETVTAVGVGLVIVVGGALLRGDSLEGARAAAERVPSPPPEQNVEQPTETFDQDVQNSPAGATTGGVLSSPAGQDALQTAEETGGFVLVDQDVGTSGSISFDTPGGLEPVDPGLRG